MKKIFYIFAAAFVAASLTVGVYAEEIEIDTTAIETAEETAETATEGETKMEAETDTETVPELSDELAELLEASAPEQVETVKQYLLYGLSTLPLSERVKLAILDYIDAVAWGLVCVTFTVMVVIYLKSNKKTSDENKIMTNNAAELYEHGAERSEAAAKIIEESEQRVRDITDGAIVAAKAVAENADDILRATAAEIIRKINELTAENRGIMEAVATRDKAITEALMAMDKTIVWLINFSDLPEAERDSVMADYNAAQKRIQEVMSDDKGQD